MRVNRVFQDEVNNDPSCTDPSQNIELRTIVDRFVKGLPIPTVGHVLTPDDFDAEDNDFCPPDALDLSEVKDAVDSAQQIVDRLLDSPPSPGASPADSIPGASPADSIPGASPADPSPEVLEKK